MYARIASITSSGSRLAITIGFDDRRPLLTLGRPRSR
jgi:hypothetical protein